MSGWLILGMVLAGWGIIVGVAVIVWRLWRLIKQPETVLVGEADAKTIAAYLGQS